MSATLDEIIAEYLQAADANHPLDREALIRTHAAHAEQLREFFEGEDLVSDQLAQPLPGPLVRPAGTEPAPIPLAEDAVKGYTIIRRLGAGGMGVVHEAEQKYPRRRVALKVIRGGRHVSDLHIRLFRREAETLARLEHPGIAAIYEAGLTSDGRHFFAMEFVDGDRLDDFLRKSDLPLREKLHLFQLVCRAVGYAHEHDVIHRDLKPSNILVTPGRDNGSHSETPQVKVLDFGLARITDADMSGATLTTEVGRILGTLQYMSPEQACGDTDVVNHSSDAYSLGVILYELVTGEPPYDIRSCQLHEAVRVICEQLPKPPSRIRARKLGRRTISGPVDARDLDTIVLKALDKDPRHRFQVAHDLADDIERLLGNEPIKARRHSIAYRSRKFFARHKMSAAFGTLLTVLLAGFGIMLSVQSEQAAQQRDEVQRSRTRETILRSEVEAQASAERRAEYTLRIALAQQAWDQARIGTLLQLLEEARPRPGEEDLRGFEWYHLWQSCHGDAATLAGHGAPVFAIAFSPDGQLLASGDVDASIVLWDVGTRQLRTKLTGHAGAVHAVAFSPDGSTLASASRDTTVMLWDVAAGTRLATLKAHSAAVEAVAFSSDGSLLCSGSQDHTAILWDVATRTKRSTLDRRHTDDVRTVAFAPDGNMLATGSWDHTVKLWNVNTARAIRTLVGHNEGIYSVRFSPDGQTLASASWDRTVRLWDVTTGRTRTTLDAHRGLVYAVAFSPDGRTLASSSADTTIKLWDAHSGEPKTTLKGHLGSVRSLAWSPDGKTLATGSSDRTVKFWDPEARQGPLTADVYDGLAESIAFAPDGKTFVAALYNYDVQVWDASRVERRFTLHGHTGWLYSVAYSPDGRRFATASADGTARLWSDANVYGLVLEEAVLADHDDAVLGVAFSPDAQTLATASADTTVKLWNLATKQVKTILSGHAAAAQCVAYAPDGKTLASAGADGSVMLWELTTGINRIELSGHRDKVYDLAFSPNGTILTTASRDKTVKLWDVAARTERMTLTGHAQAVFAVAFSPDGKFLATGSADQTVKIWDAATGQERATLREHEHTIRTLSFSPDGRTLLSGGEDGTIRVWRAAPVGSGEPSSQASSRRSSRAIARESSP